MKNKKKAFGIIAIILIILGIFMIKPIKHYIIRRDNFNWITYGMKQQYEAKQLNVQEEIKFNIKGMSNLDEQEKLLNEMFNNMTLRLESNYDVDNFRNLTKIQLKNKNEKLANIDLFSNKEGIIVQCSDIFNGNLYLDYKEICRLLNKSNDANYINVENYLPLFDISKNPYAKNINKDLFYILKNNLNHKFQKNKNVLAKVNLDGKERLVKYNELKISLNNDDIKSILKELNKFAKDNPNIKLFLKSKIEEFFDIARKNNDLNKFGLTENDIKEFKENKNFDKEWEEAFTQIINEIDNTQTNDDFKLDMSFKFDDDDKIRNILCVYTLKLPNNLIFNINQNININYSLDKQIFDSSKYTKDIKLTEINPSNLNEDLESYIKNVELKLTKLYPMLNENINNSIINNNGVDFNNSDDSTNEEYNDYYDENNIN